MCRGYFCRFWLPCSVEFRTDCDWTFYLSFLPITSLLPLLLASRTFLKISPWSHTSRWVLNQSQKTGFFLTDVPISGNESKYVHRFHKRRRSLYCHPAKSTNFDPLDNHSPRELRDNFYSIGEKWLLTYQENQLTSSHPL